MAQLPLPACARHKYEIPDWVKKAGDDVFPAGAKKLYRYLLVFGLTGCWQWNCRLAKQFKTTERTVQRWLNWLKDHKLIRVKQPYNRRRVIYACPCGDYLEFLTKPMFVMPARAVKEARLSEGEIQARKERALRVMGCDLSLPRLPFPDLPAPLYGG